MKKALVFGFALLAWSAVAQTIGPGGGGGGGGGGSGTVTSIATGCLATGGTITTTGTISTAQTVNLQTGTNYAIQGSDCGKLVDLSNGSNQVPTIAQAGTGSFTSGWFADVCNLGAGTQTLTPTTSTINGAATYVLAAGNVNPQCIRVVSDGTNYQIDGGIIPTAVTSANPSATAGPNAVNGTAPTFMTSDSAPAVQKGTAAQFGLMECDGTTLTCAASVNALNLSNANTWAAKQTYGSGDIVITNVGPPSDSTTALQITKADLSTRIMDFDTTNARVGINKTPGAFDLDVNGATNLGSTVTVGGNLSLGSSSTSINNTATNVNGGQTLLAIGNVATGTAASGTINFRNNNNNEVTMVLTGTNNPSSGTGGLFTINNSEATATGGFNLQTAGANAITISKAQAVGLPGIASSSAAQTGTVCWTTGGGNLTVDTTVGCLSSLEELKDIRSPITGALAEIMQLKPFWYSWKEGTPERVGDKRVQPGLGAHATEAIDSRLTGYGTDGKLQGVRYQQMVAVLVAAVQEQQREIALLKKQIHSKAK